MSTQGDVPNLYAPEDDETITTACKQDCLRKRLQPTKLNIFACYLARVMANLHLILCFSPLGEAFRNRLRMFPSLVNCSTIDWFAEWPREALHSVAHRLLTEENLELGDKNVHLESRAARKSKVYGALVLHRRVDRHAIFMIPARWRGGSRRSTSAEHRGRSNRLEFDKETTLMAVRWPRVASTASHRSLAAQVVRHVLQGRARVRS
jgi:hypothetical protein